MRKNLKRATIVGDRTSGAGHNATFVPSGFGFQTSISVSRVSDPRTGLEWEQVGVQPDVTAGALASYAGEYDGNRRVTVMGDKLMYETGIGAIPEPLVALSDSGFALASQTRLHFGGDDRGAARLQAHLPDGSTATFSRTKP